jgi:hypothetical protein
MAAAQRNFWLSNSHNFILSDTAGILYGNGAGLSNVPPIGSVTNVFVHPLDVTVKVVTNTPSDFSVATTNISPVYRLFTNGVLVGPKGVISTAGTVTAGIQEAINDMPLAANSTPASKFTVPGGGRIELQPGKYVCTGQILIPSYTNRPFNLKIEGVGLPQVIYNGPGGSNFVITTEYSGGTLYNGLRLEVEGISWLMIPNTTNMLFKIGAWQDVRFRNNTFAWNMGLTNEQAGTSGGYTYNYELKQPVQPGVVGVWLEPSSSVWSEFTGNTFFGLACGIAHSGNRGIISGNNFGNVGSFFTNSAYTYTTLWTNADYAGSLDVSSLMGLGPAIVYQTFDSSDLVVINNSFLKCGAGVINYGGSITVQNDFYFGGNYKIVNYSTGGHCAVNHSQGGYQEADHGDAIIHDSGLTPWFVFSPQTSTTTTAPFTIVSNSVLGLTVWGNLNASNNLAVNGTVTIKGGSPSVNRVLTSDATGIASWQDPVTGTGGTVSNFNAQALVFTNSFSVSNANFAAGSKLDTNGNISASGVLNVGGKSYLTNSQSTISNSASIFAGNLFEFWDPSFQDWMKIIPGTTTLTITSPDGPVTLSAGQFNGSGAGLNLNTVPVGALSINANNAYFFTNNVAVSNALNNVGVAIGTNGTVQASGAVSASTFNGSGAGLNADTIKFTSMLQDVFGLLTNNFGVSNATYVAGVQLGTNGNVSASGTVSAPTVSLSGAGPGNITGAGISVTNSVSTTTAIEAVLGTNHTIAVFSPGAGLAVGTNDVNTPPGMVETTNGFNALPGAVFSGNASGITNFPLMSPSGFALPWRPGARWLIQEDIDNGVVATIPPNLNPANSGGQVAGISDIDSNHIGLISLNCITNAGSYSEVSGRADSVIFSTADWYFECAFRFTNVDSPTLALSNGWFKVGFVEGRIDIASQSAGAWAQLLNTTNNWAFVTAQASTRTTNITTTAGWTANWQTIGIYSPYPNTSATLYINGVNTVTLSSNLPQGKTQPSTPRIGAGASAAGLGFSTFGVNVDYMWVGISPHSWP